VISTRFLPVLCAVVAVALIPTFIHSYSGSTVQDGRSAAAIPTSLAGYHSTPSRRNPSWFKRKFETDDWTERTYRSAGDEVTLSVVRSYDPKRLYHHPELALAYGPSYLRTERRRFAQRPDIPVHVLYAESDATVAIYTLHYGERFVENPISFQLRMAGELLFSGRKAMTLFFLSDEHVPESTDIDRLQSLGLFFAAIDHFLASEASGVRTR
jgi:hypothetical protein